MSRCSAMLLFALLTAAGAPGVAPRFPLRDGQRVVFLGDSNTNAGMYVQYLDAYLFTRFPGSKFELINLGLPSETVSGLSEPDHPYPRPVLRERLERVFAKASPDVLVACYGMNDGIYYPFSEERFAKYRQGIRELLDRAHSARVPITLITPPPFDPLPVRDKTLPATAPKFSWVAPFAGYDDVLARYSNWLLTMRPQVAAVVDARTAVARYLAATRRTEPGYTLSTDGVHLNATSHWLIAGSLLEAWHAPVEIDRAAIDAHALKVKQGWVRDLARAGDGIQFKWTARVPMPLDPAWDQRLLASAQSPAEFNRYHLVVTGLPADRYAVLEGANILGQASRAQLEAGVDPLNLEPRIDNPRARRILEITGSTKVFSFAGAPGSLLRRHSAELWPLIQQRQQLLAPAWLTEVGHKRPGTPAGLPLAEARHLAEALETRIRELAQPVPITIRLVAMGK